MDELVDLPRYAANLVGEVLERTGCPLAVQEQHGIGYGSKLQVATERSPVHLLLMAREYREHIRHFLVNACVKINRFWDAPEEDRLIAVGTQPARLCKADENELRRKTRGLPPHDLESLSRHLHHGVLQQLTSMPVDLRVEREIAETMTQHADAQRAYLQRHVKDLDPRFAIEFALVVPIAIYRASTGMNAAMVQEAIEIAGVKPGPLYGMSNDRWIGERLGALLDPGPGVGGDCAAVDAWAEELGYRHRYEWRRLEDVR